MLDVMMSSESVPSDERNPEAELEKLENEI